MELASTTVTLALNIILLSKVFEISFEFRCKTSLSSMQAEKVCGMTFRWITIRLCHYRVHTNLAMFSDIGLLMKSVWHSASFPS